MTDYQSLAEFRYQLRKFLHASESRVVAAGLEPQQQQLMLQVKALSETEQPTIVRLAERLQLRHHSVVGLVDRLAGKGLVARVKDTDDQRRVIVQLTPEGETVIEALSQFHEQELRDRGPHLIAALQSVLQTVQAAAHSEDPA